jgi:hypothetical protein
MRKTSWLHYFMEENIDAALSIGIPPQKPVLDHYGISARSADILVKRLLSLRQLLVEDFRNTKRGWTTWKSSPATASS